MYTGPSSADGTSTPASSSNKRPRPMPFVRHICVVSTHSTFMLLSSECIMDLLQHQFHIGKTDFAHVNSVQVAAVALREQLLETASALWGAAPLHSASYSSSSSSCPGLDRARLGLILRQATHEHFSAALTLATASIALEDLYRYLADRPDGSGGSASVSERATQLLVRQVAVEGADSERTALGPCEEEDVSAWTRILGRCDQVRSALEQNIRDLQLEGELQRPSLPLSGHDLKRVS
jgi:hypothetical protein